MKNTFLGSTICLLILGFVYSNNSLNINYRLYENVIQEIRLGIKAIKKMNKNVSNEDICISFSRIEEMNSIVVTLNGLEENEKMRKCYYR